MPILSIEAVKQTRDCTNMNLSNRDLSDLDLSGKNFTGANLENANLKGANLKNADLRKTKLKNADLTDVNLRGAILPATADLSADFSFQYKGATLTLEMVATEVLGPLTIGKETPHINRNNIFELLQFIQRNLIHGNPNYAFAKKLEHELTLCAIRHSAKAPETVKAPNTGLTADTLSQWKTQFNGGGLAETDILLLMQHMRITAPEGTVRTTFSAGARTTDHYTAPFDFIEGAKARVINIAKTLDELPYNAANWCRVDRDDFARVLSDIALMQKTIDCIQMPLAAGSGRDHFLHLQIYKKTNGEIGARVIDSTVNHPLAKVPVDFVQSVLAENVVLLQKILGTKTATVSPVSVVRTNEQMRPTDKKCPLYAAKGIQATTETLLQQGAAFLQSDDRARNAVRHQHHMVSKTDEIGIVFQLTNVNLPKASAAPVDQPVLEQPTPAAREPEAARNELEEPLMLQDHLSESVDTYSSDSLADVNYRDVKAENIKSIQKQSNSTFAQIDTLLNNLNARENGKDLQEAVKIALETYIAENTKKSMFLTLFRQMSNAGKDYAKDALKRIKDNRAEALNIAKEILHMGAKENGELEVKYNSRVHHLLKTLEEKNLISAESVPEVGFRDAKVSMNTIKENPRLETLRSFVGTDKPPTPK